MKAFLLLEDNDERIAAFREAAASLGKNCGLEKGLEKELANLWSRSKVTKNARGGLGPASQMGNPSRICSCSLERT